MHGKLSTEMQTANISLGNLFYRNLFYRDFCVEYKCIQKAKELST